MHACMLCRQAADAQAAQSAKNYQQVPRREYLPGELVFVQANRDKRSKSTVRGKHATGWPAVAEVVKPSHTTTHFYQVKWITQGIAGKPGTLSKRLVPTWHMKPCTFPLATIKASFPGVKDNDGSEEDTQRLQAPGTQARTSRGAKRLQRDAEAVGEATDITAVPSPTKSAQRYASFWRVPAFGF